VNTRSSHDTAERKTASDATGDAEFFGKHNMSSELAKIIKQSKRGATDEQCLQVASQLRNAAGRAIVFFANEPRFETRIKPEVICQLQEELATALAEDFLAEAKSLAESIKKSDYRS
jgi:hypothetical protein